MLVVVAVDITGAEVVDTAAAVVVHR